MRIVRSKLAGRTVRRNGIVLAASLLAIVGMSVNTALAQNAPSTSHPRDFTGVWTNANLTPPTGSCGVDKLVVSPEEARKIATTSPILAVPREEAGLTDHVDPNAPPPEKGATDFGVKGYNSFWWATGDSLAQVKGEYRTSNVVDPPAGSLPMVAGGVVCRWKR